MFYIQFLREINWEWLSSDKPDAIYSHAHRRRQHQPARVPKVGTSYFQKHTWHMFYIQYFKRIRLGMFSDMSEASKSTRPSPTRGYVIFLKTHILMFYIQFFKIYRLGMVSDMSENSKSCSSTTSTSLSPTSGYVIFSKTHMAHVLYPIFQENSIGNGLIYVRDLQVMLIDVDNVNLAKFIKWEQCHWVFDPDP